MASSLPEQAAADKLFLGRVKKTEPTMVSQLKCFYYSSSKYRPPCKQMPVSQRGSRLEAIINRPQPSVWEEFRRQPRVYIARALNDWRQLQPSSPDLLPVSVVCISDTHNSRPRLPDGDVLIHAGDLTQSGTFEELKASVVWLSSQPRPFKIVVAGNHDVLLDPKQDGTGSRTRSTAGDHSQSPQALRDALDWKGRGIVYLENQEADVTCPNGRRLRIYGSPLSPRNGNWAFQYLRTDNVWRDTIPEGVDILITHGPPRGHLDLLSTGCNSLLREV